MSDIKFGLAGWALLAAAFIASRPRRTKRDKDEQVFFEESGKHNFGLLQVPEPPQQPTISSPYPPNTWDAAIQRNRLLNLLTRQQQIPMIDGERLNELTETVEIVGVTWKGGANV
jgi:hypothetical protein